MPKKAEIISHSELEAVQQLSLLKSILDLQNALNTISGLNDSGKLLQIQNIELEKSILEAQESSRLKSEFLANISHELRTPLNAIIGFAELIHDGKVDSANTKKFLDDIISSAHQLLSLINDVLDLAKIEAGKMEFHPEKINLAKILDAIKDTFQTSITKKNIQFKIAIDPNLGEIVIDPEKFIQILYNYLSNAFKFTPMGGHVNVRIHSDTNNQFRLEVQDTGIGIRHEDLGHLFAKFHQLDSGTAKKYAGTGLGLALTKRIVEAQGGKVGVESTLGKGSTFHAILPNHPYHRSLVSADKKAAQSNNTERKPTILVIEHESQERELIVDALINEGYDVLTADNIISATEQHHKHRFDAIILDLFQPDMSKWEIIRTLRSKLPVDKAPPIVVKVMIDQPISFGFRIHDFLLKPVNPQELLAALKWAGAPPQQNKSILIIDSDSKALAFAHQTLAPYGFNVIGTANKISGLLALENEQPDVVLLDPFMPGMDGFEFLRSYRQTERGLYTPLIIWTVTKLSGQERKRFKNSIQRVMLTGQDLKKNILAELEQHLPPIKT